jgi:hypothetical protein
MTLELTSLNGVEQSLAEKNETRIVSRVKQEKAEEEYKWFNGRNKTLTFLFKEVTPLLTNGIMSHPSPKVPETSASAVLFCFHSVWFSAD